MTDGTDQHQQSAPQRGTLVSWNPDRGFGFLTPEAGGADVFVHIRAFPRGTELPVVGEPHDFSIELGPDGRRRAAHVIPLKVTRAGRLKPVDAAAARAPRPRGAVIGLFSVLAFLLIFVLVDFRWPFPFWVGVLYLGLSAACVIVYAVDKSAATAGRWRTSESSLLALGLVGGWPGAVIGQQLFRHKTRKLSFQRLFWVTVLLNVVVFILLTTPLVPWLARGSAVTLFGS